MRTASIDDKVLSNHYKFTYCRLLTGKILVLDFNNFSPSVVCSHVNNKIHWVSNDSFSLVQLNVILFSYLQYRLTVCLPFTMLTEKSKRWLTREQLGNLFNYDKRRWNINNKEIAGSKEWSPKVYCLQKAEVVIKHYLYTKTWQRKPPFMKRIKER